MYLTFKRFLAWGLIACLPLAFAGCGGGGGGSVPTTTVSGVATVSGPIKGALVQVFKLNADGSTGELLGSGQTGDDGRYAVRTPTAKTTPPLLVKVSGQTGSSYQSEAGGAAVAFTPDESFNAVVDTLSANQVIAANPLSEAAYQKLQQVLTAEPGVVADVKTTGAVNTLVADLFNVSSVLADPASSLANQAALLVIDQMIANTGTTTTPAMNLINQAFADLADPSIPADSPGPAYQTYLTELTTAGNAVIADISGTDPQLAAAAQNLLNAAQTPASEPVWTDTTPPSAPANLAATVETINSTSAAATLSWTASSDDNGVTGYDVYRDGNIIARVSSPGYRDTTLVPGSTYTYFVVAFDGLGNRSAQSGTVSAKANPVNLNITVDGQISSDITSLPEVLDLVAPSAPTNLTASTSSVTSTTSSVNLSWSTATDNKGVTGYEVFRNGAKIVTVTSTGYTDPSVASGTTFSYHVVAVDASGNRSANSNTVSVTPPAVNLDITVGGQIIP